MEQLKLENQLCFPLYAASRLVTREYQPLLDKLGITYPQYLVMLILWEKDEMPVNDIARKLILNTNTVTPLLKRMDTLGLIQRTRSKGDERMVLITLTERGKELKKEAASIPEKLLSGLGMGAIDLPELLDLREKLNRLIHHLLENNPEVVEK